MLKMSVAKRFWEGTLTKGGTEIGFAEGSISIDRNLQRFYELGRFDLAHRRSVARVIECTIEHGYISEALFATPASGASDVFFTIAASMSDHAIRLSGCSVADYSFELPADGWITESISISVKEMG